MLTGLKNLAATPIPTKFIAVPVTASLPNSFRNSDVLSDHVMYTSLFDAAQATHQEAATSNVGAQAPAVAIVTQIEIPSTAANFAASWENKILASDKSNHHSPKKSFMISKISCCCVVRFDHEFERCWRISSA